MSFTSPTQVRQQLRTQGTFASLLSGVKLTFRKETGSKANTFWTVGRDMVRTEGTMSLMKGLTASMLREVTYSGIRMGTYEYFKDA